MMDAKNLWMSPIICPQPMITSWYIIANNGNLIPNPIQKETVNNQQSIEKSLNGSYQGPYDKSTPSNNEITPKNDENTPSDYEKSIL